MSELFKPSEVEMDSPKIRWMKKYNLKCECDESLFGNDEYEPWSCWDMSLENSFGDLENNYSTGNTEDEAIAAYAKKHGIKLWNEEGL